MVDAHFDFIWRALRGLGVAPASADDAAQQVFWIASQKVHAIAPGAERSFLFSTAVGVAANHRRSAARVREVADAAALEARADDRPDPEELSSMKEARELLDRLLDAMPIDLRAVFVLFELEGLTTGEVAALLELAPGTVSSRLKRARETFRAAVHRLHARTRTPGGKP